MEAQRRIWRDTWPPARTISEVARDIKCPSIARFHEAQTFDPAFNNGVGRKFCRRAAIIGAVEDFSVWEETMIIDFDDLTARG